MDKQTAHYRYNQVYSILDDTKYQYRIVLSNGKSNGKKTNYMTITRAELDAITVILTGKNI